MADMLVLHSLVYISSRAALHTGPSGILQMHTRNRQSEVGHPAGQGATDEAVGLEHNF